MKDHFAITDNVQKFIRGVEVLETPIGKRLGMMLGFGAPGTGKTNVAEWYALQKNIPYIRSKDITSKRSLLANIAGELGEAPAYRSEDLFDQIFENLTLHPRVLIIDEIDYLLKHGAVEVLRDINDMTNTPIVLMGMENADRKLKKYRHLFDRITVTVRFELFSAKDIAGLATEICEIPLSDCGVKFIRDSGHGKLRTTTMWFTRAEKLAAQNDIETITADHLNRWKD